MDFDLYPKSRTPFDEQLFRDPTAEYRGTPFWAWNGKLDRGELLRQLDVFQQMGMGGAHAHVRTGLTTPYLGEAYMAHVKACVEHCRRRGMLLWLYDEDRWPSGAAGGLVTRDPSLRRKWVLFTRHPYGTVPLRRPVDNSVSRTGEGRLLARYAIELREGLLHRCHRLAEGETPPAGTGEWFAYLETDFSRPWFNGQAYLDTLNPAAVRRFIAVTHEAYRRAVGDDFGGVVPAIFTDEPQYGKKWGLLAPDADNDVFLPFTDDLCDTYSAAFGQRLEDVLPELVFERDDDGAARTRWRYHEHLTERFSQAFGDQLGAWCGRNRIALTGHMMSEESLGSQTHAIGEAMRGYRSMQLPGIDLLVDKHEYTTARQCQSAVRQFGRCGMLSELYGVTNWDFPFAGHKAQGDWQAAMGVTVRVPHLAWMQMGGESKRDYPASIFFQSPWWQRYKPLEDHFSRVNVAMTRGRPVVRVAMIHPIESMWITSGPRSQNADSQAEQEQWFREGVEWLTSGLIDFDYISESLLPDQQPAVVDGKLKVGQMTYDAVVLPPLRTIRSSTLDCIEKLVKAEGWVLPTGAHPELVDGVESDRARRVFEAASMAEPSAWSRTRLLSWLELFRDVRARHADGAPAQKLVYQLREDGDTRYLFIANTERRFASPGTKLSLRGEWRPTVMDTFGGSLTPLAATYADGWTDLTHDFDACGHLLLRLEPGRSAVPATPAVRWTTLAELPAPVRITLDEPNALLLDQAAFRIDDSPWQGREETLRIQNAARRAFGLAETDGYIVQPWADTEPKPVLGHVTLRFVIESEVAIASPVLALEDVDVSEITLDGRAVPAAAEGWWVDPCLAKVALPAMSAGRHELAIRRPFHRKSTIEWCYLLGDFGVRVAGRFATITPAVRKLQWGDFTTQGLPFYTGNVTYHCPLPAETPGRFAVRVPHHRAITLQLSHGGQAVDAMTPPYRAVFERRGDEVAVTAFGHRGNAFGPLHHADPHDKWIGPRAWRTSGDAWSYEYQLKPMGILASPVVESW